MSTRELLTVVEVPITDLKPSADNPRSISGRRLEQLARSLKVEPDMLRARPLIATPDGSIIAGEMRWRAAQKAGMENVWVVFADLDEERRREWMIRDNQSYGEWDDSALDSMLKELASKGRDLDLVGIDRRQVDLIMSDVSPALTSPDEAPAVDEVKKKPRSKTGVLWQLGNHRLLCGDSTKSENLERLLDGGQVDVLWTDPPYGVSYVGKTKDALTIQNDGVGDIDGLLAGAFGAADGVLKPGAAIYVAHPAGPISLQFGVAFKEQGWRFSQTLVWVKNHMVLGHADYHYEHEPILYGYKDDHDHVTYGHKTEGAEGRLGRGGERWFGDNSQTSVFKVPRPAASREHPTMKPIDLIEPCLMNSSPRDGAVLDLFGGSGSTLIAAEKCGRQAFLVELDPVYCDVILARWEAYTGRKAKKLS